MFKLKFLADIDRKILLNARKSKLSSNSSYQRILESREYASETL